MTGQCTYSSTDTKIAAAALVVLVLAHALSTGYTLFRAHTVVMLKEDQVN